MNVSTLTRRGARDVGRKRKKPSERKSHYIKVMLTPAQFAEINAAAAAQSDDTSTWVRREILKLIREKRGGS